MKKLLAVLMSVGLFAGIAQADLLLGWNVDGVGDVETLGSVYNDPGLQASTISIAGASTLGVASGANSFSMNAWSQGTSLADAITGNSYFSFTITPQSGWTFDVDSISWRTSRSATGANNFALLSSATGFTAADALDTLGNSATTAQTFHPAFDDLGLTGLSGPVEFRVYGWGATAAGGSVRIGTSLANAFGEPGSPPDGTATLEFAVFGEAIPEPGTAMLTLLGLGMIAALRRKATRA